ncbi:MULTISPECIES: hypothetical protein [Streptomyces]|uniref:Transmembrane protein n=1 Tax=Streptomyces spinosisporus TaxID=2927582 RepID=A0ABS9XEV2_9ACTN|nr:MULTISPECIES: hypothetical protein [Streptomyces]MCI3240628.1 hypothetical protein [Streptomyces spinosisporus]WUB37213.1 hypothetical protein OHN38_20800 [Streptomyces sp. NBC_00588]
MTSAPDLRPEDRADFERALSLALGADDIRSALRDDPTGRATVRLRDRALGDAEAIAAAAGDEYLAFLAARDAATNPEAAASRRIPAAGNTLWAALAVLVPLVSAAAAVILLLTGYALRLADTATRPASSVVKAGWLLALVAVVTAGFSLWALLRTALNQRTGTSLNQAREHWQQALLERGIRPYLRRHLPEALTP